MYISKILLQPHYQIFLNNLFGKRLVPISTNYIIDTLHYVWASQFQAHGGEDESSRTLLPWQKKKLFSSLRIKTSIIIIYLIKSVNNTMLAKKSVVIKDNVL